MPVEDDLTAQHLDVYDGKDGWWNPERGVVEPPEDWALLESGNAFVTRTVKAADVYWFAWLARSRSRRHRRLIGIWAPAATIRAAQASATETESARAARRESGARSRAQRYEAEQNELTAAVLALLSFSREHSALAESIATAAGERAATVGSGRVGRTKTLPLEERAALAARAEIRHSHTDYHERLDDVGLDDELYRQVKAEAHVAVDRFLDEHRS